MGETWQGAFTDWLPRNFNSRVTEPPDPEATYNVSRQGDRMAWTTALPEMPVTTLPIEVIMGGRRHGLGFLARIEQLGGLPLQRPALIQGRYEWSFTRQALVLAPGCSARKPDSWETGFGIVLSPTFEARCLACHGQPGSAGSGKQGGVHCESCHGPGSEHLLAIAKHSPSRAIVNPKKLGTEESIAVCAQCHVGLTKFPDPLPDDLLVANQVHAITNSECFIQSGKAFACTACHNPHGDSADAAARSMAVCLSCHTASTKQHAAICPINATANCLGCHMPAVEMGPLHLVDHLIRVHPEQGVTARTEAAPEKEARRSHIRPLREFLRIIVTNSREQGDMAERRLAHGEGFYDVAREISADPSAPIGGYLGPKWLSQMDPAMQNEAARLNYGQTGRLIGTDGRWEILQRLAREFKWQAGQLQQQASAQLAAGSVQGAIEKAQQALKIYPHFLRALNLIGTTFAESGNVLRASEIFGLASRLYPDDAATLVKLGMMFGELGHHTEELEAYKKAIELEPDLLAAYPKLGMALYAGGDPDQAIVIFRKGLQINPLSAELYHDLGLALAQRGDTQGAKQWLGLATKIDPGERHKF
jgi:Flp pilus assembly protein TadD